MGINGKHRDEGSAAVGGWTHDPWQPTQQGEGGLSQTVLTKETGKYVTIAEKCLPRVTQWEKNVRDHSDQL